ncbi:MAG: SH3 domain-containing protein, partial [bacterium]
EAALRDMPNHLSRVVVRLSYADEVTLLETQRDWLRVRFDGNEGWLHQDAVSEDRIVLGASDRDVGREADSREVALAGRGFNAQVEEEFQSQSGLDFGPVDELEARVVDEDELQRFLEDGELQLPGGNES